MIRCQELRQESYRCGDEYYRSMTIWAKSPKTRESTEACDDVARIYERALDKLIECLLSSSHSSQVNTDLALASEYKLLLTADIEVLAQYLNRQHSPIKS